MNLEFDQIKTATKTSFENTRTRIRLSLTFFLTFLENFLIFLQTQIPGISIVLTNCCLFFLASSLLK